MLTKTMPNLMVEISDWAVANFGNTPVSSLRVLHNGFPSQNAIIELNWIAPFWGLAEEIGELHAALNVPTIEANYLDEVIDAIADIGIYFCDYLARRKTIYDFRQMGDHAAKLDLSIAYGKLVHCELKHAQKIRGMGETEAFNAAHREACLTFFKTLDYVSFANSGLPIEEVIDRTFQETVSKRNWKKNAATGA